MRKRLPIALLTIFLAASIAMALAGIPLTQAQVAKIEVGIVDTLPIDPRDPYWAEAPKTEVALASQQLVYPLPTEITSKLLKVAAATDGSLIAFYLEWEDPQPDTPKAGGIDVFEDKVAIQFPVRADSLPYICMGTVEEPVSIVLWKAPDTAETLVAGSGYGLKPEEREALGLHSVPTNPIELLPPDAQVWKANATYEDGKWKVVLYRPLGSPHPLVTSLKPGMEVSVAFAVWDGSKGEIGGKKSTSAWFTLAIPSLAAPAPAEKVTETVTVTETMTQTVERVATARETVLGDWSMAALGALLAALLYTAVLAIVYFSRKGSSTS
ncbi:MAG: ethylbenzene dehydrogenase-related protein [Desulfurococcales archaeon]|nr:ethylbenzene dehydrogenase-related protein [Desulfurococcales archaeon]